MDPLGAIFFDRVKNSGLEPLKDQAVGALRLAVAPGVSHGGIVYVDAIVLEEIPELNSGEGGAQVRDDTVRYSEPVLFLR